MIFVIVGDRKIFAKWLHMLGSRLAQVAECI